MEGDELRAARMRAQRLDGPADDVAGLVRALVGLQAQEPRAAPLQVRARTSGLTVADVERALVEERSIVRLWAMRGTLHYVPAEDAGWLLELLAPRAMPGQQRALDVLGVPEAHRPRAVEVIVKALADGPLTRAELADHLRAAGIRVEGQIAAHLPRLAALEGHICFGPRRGGKDTFVLLDDWLGERTTLPHDEALAELARRYAGAYGPAEPRDLATWAGLPVGDARTGWEAVQATDTQHAEPPDPPIIRMLPAFDTYLLGYRSRDAAVPPEHAKRLWPGGGIVRPAILSNGLAVATWRMERRETRATITVEPFGALDMGAVEAEVADIGRFLGVDARLA